MRILVLVMLVTAFALPSAAEAKKRTAKPRVVDAALVLQPRKPTPLATPGNPDITVDPGNPMTIRVGSLQTGDPIDLYTVPQGQSFVLTDIDGSYSCGCWVCRLYDSTGLRLAWRLQDDTGGTADLTRSYVSGVRFAAGTTITLAPPTWGGCLAGPNDNAFVGFMTLMGRLEEAP
jgi:hypothetical protein